jgi:hypothetical protein
MNDEDKLAMLKPFATAKSIFVAGTTLQDLLPETFPHVASFKAVLLQTEDEAEEPSLPGEHEPQES